jgi:hypothetical protein
MNIIKFKDIKIDTKDNSTSVELFNNTFRNKYCYAISWKWAVPFDVIDNNGVRNIEETGDFPVGMTVLDIDEFKEYIDLALTEKSNNVNKFKEFNKFTPDIDITLDDLKKFRFWLADTLLNIYDNTDDLTEKQTQMLTYYQKNMYDVVIDQLSNFKSTSNSSVSYISSSCSCTQNVSLLSDITTTCDPISTYRKEIYNYMVEVFRELDFWKDMEDEFIEEFKKYIDGIIAYDLPLYESDYISDFADCSCVNGSNLKQQPLMSILKNLSTSLGYILNNEIEGHKNFISDSLYNWSSKLYEKMYWI